MKNILLSLCITLCAFQFNQAQEIADHAIGLRLGGNDGLGTEISYQHGLSDTNRIEANLGWRSNSFNIIKITGLYQWVWDLDDTINWNYDGSFNWYAGAGGGILTWDHKHHDSNGTALFIAGDIGIEYKFEFPLLLSLDFRPEFYFNKDYNDNVGLDIALSARYTF